MVAKYFTSTVACSCEGWRWRHRCRHVDELRRAREIIQKAELKWQEAKDGHQRSGTERRG